MGEGGAQAPLPPRTQLEVKRKEEEVRGQRRKKKREEEKGAPLSARAVSATKKNTPTVAIVHYQVVRRRSP